MAVFIRLDLYNVRPRGRYIKPSLGFTVCRRFNNAHRQFEMESSVSYSSVTRELWFLGLYAPAAARPNDEGGGENFPYY